MNESHFHGKRPVRPSETITPATDVEGEEDGYRVLGDGDDEVEACDLCLDVPVFRGPGVVLEIVTKLRRHIEFILYTDLD